MSWVDMLACSLSWSERRQLAEPLSEWKSCWNFVARTLPGMLRRAIYCCHVVRCDIFGVGKGGYALPTPHIRQEIEIAVTSAGIEWRANVRERMI